MISDAHVHFGLDSLVGEKIDEYRLDKLFKKYNVEKSLVFPFDIEVDKTNEKIIRLSNMRKEIYGLIRITPSLVKKYTNILDKILNDKIVGVKFHPSMDKTRVTSSIFESIFEILNEHNAIALIHAGRWQEMSSYKFPIEIAKKYSNVKVIMAHMGGNEIPNTKSAIMEGKDIPNLYFETSNCRIPALLKLAVKELGKDRILFGSDAPLGSLGANIHTVIDAELPEEVLDAILYSNLKKLLNDSSAL